ncbi:MULTISPECIES: radical SAM family heme chaperone HemW [Clostridium]|uniref:radical SAM family heme chaperone HemW n=1 Tax=Clostridium TaxID=1485 RepID=UPI0021533666|nr:radical SAM family heme chaperone HemW [Clostridium sp. LY3-2]MCR6513504.1 radical SAM family heme chaperone HemW [Clostridium sp. LY3-2]
MKELSLYVHIPFCKSKCLYCDFPSYGGKDHLKKDYILALCKEIEEKSKDKIINTLFIGGGTPSYLDEEDLEILLKTLNNLTYKKDAEKTIECNPGTLNKKKIEIIKDNGINRVSLGLQTTNDNLLKEIGRIHTFKIFKDNYEELIKGGITNINIDLMFGLPNQNLGEFLNTLNDVLKLNPNHISVYSLIIEEGTPFYNLYEKDMLKLPSEEEEREMYSKAKELLEEKGYHQYEISNYSKKDKECKHNIVYWKLEDYLGVGVSSSSYVEGERFKNIDDIEKYIKNINEGHTVIETKSKNSEKEDIEEFIFLGLRLIDGINLKEFEKRFKVSIFSIYEEVIEKYIKTNALTIEGGNLKFTPKGIEISNYILSDFIK